MSRRQRSLQQPGAAEGTCRGAPVAGGTYSDKDQADVVSCAQLVLADTCSTFNLHATNHARPVPYISFKTERMLSGPSGQPHLQPAGLCPSSVLCP